MSKTSLGMGSGMDEEGNSVSGGPILTPEGGAPPGEVIYDTIVYVIYCPQHDKMALTRAFGDDKLKAVWLPFVALSSITTWKKSAEDGLRYILLREDPELEAKLAQELRIPTTVPKRLYINRTQIAGIKKFVTRLIYYVQTLKSPDFKCCENSKRIHWYPLNDVLNDKVDKLWDPTVKQMAELCKNPKSQGITEYTLKSVYTYVKDKGQSVTTAEEELLRMMKISRQDVDIIYNDFLDHCFPSILMSIHSFKEYLNKYGFNSIDDQIFQMLFNAFDYDHKKYIEFSQLLLGLALIDPNAPTKATRVGFVFRYYDFDGDGYLNHSELTRLIKDLSPKSDTEVDIQRKTREAKKTFNDSDNKVSYKDFMAGVAALKFRGTSELCKTQKSIISEILKSTSSKESLRLAARKTASNLLKSKRKDKGPCPQHRAGKYEWGQHAVQLDTNGKLSECLLLFEDNDINSQFETFGIDSPSPSRTYSMEFAFPVKSLAITLIEMIREFNEKERNLENSGFLSEVSQREDFVTKLRKIYVELEPIFSAEERVIRIQDPVWVIGDIFGNLYDLMAMERILWKGFPIISANFVFLGNYVDYGKWGVETVVYLFCLKMMAPNKVLLLRGRHENRDVQKKFTFERECLQKYGQNYGKTVFELINNLFDRFPVALVIDESIFCANSGIPNISGKVLDYNSKVNAILKSPSESDFVWQLLNNEPSPKPLKTKSGFSERQKIDSKYLFDEIAVNEFLERNAFSHIICSKFSTNGIGVYFSSRFLTVFTSSRFKNPSTPEVCKEPAVLQLKNCKMTFVRLDIPPEDTNTDTTSRSIAEKTT